MNDKTNQTESLKQLDFQDQGVEWLSVDPTGETLLMCKDQRIFMAHVEEDVGEKLSIKKGQEFTQDIYNTKKKNKDFAPVWFRTKKYFVVDNGNSTKRELTVWNAETACKV